MRSQVRLADTRSAGLGQTQSRQHFSKTWAVWTDQSLLCQCLTPKVLSEAENRGSRQGQKAMERPGAPIGGLSFRELDTHPSSPVEARMNSRPLLPEIIWGATRAEGSVLLLPRVRSFLSAPVGARE